MLGFFTWDLGINLFHRMSRENEEEANVVILIWVLLRVRGLTAIKKNKKNWEKIEIFMNFYYRGGVKVIYH